jgi:hypothetical protein
MYEDMLWYREACIRLSEANEKKGGGASNVARPLAAPA